ncbi:MAG: alpha/beta fold hydrolase, partial [Myxococcales bacterium]|nr:alpha/beta fold hydrolase [Myxococcales bacterium]
VNDIPLTPSDRSYRAVTRVTEKLHVLRDKPMLIFWGGQDFVFNAPFLEEWRKHFPNAEVHEYPDAGHFVLEDASNEIIPHVRRFLGLAP